jgi:hypothetical protein
MDLMKYIIPTMTDVPMLPIMINAAFFQVVGVTGFDVFEEIFSIVIPFAERSISPSALNNVSIKILIYKQWRIYIEHVTTIFHE